MITEPGVYDLPEAQYHRDPVEGGSASSTQLRSILAPGCPALVDHERRHPKFKDSYDLGSVAHRLTLGTGCPIVEVPADSWQSKAAREAREAARADGAVALLSKDLAAARAMAAAVHDNQLAHALLTLPGRPEQTVVAQVEASEPGGPVTRVWGRAMVDKAALPDDPSPCLIDLKTTDKGLDDESISKTVWSYKYHQQDAWYRWIWYLATGVWPAFYFVFVQKDPPHLVRVVELDDDLRARGGEANLEALAIWADCHRTGIWPAYGADDPALIGAPAWARRTDRALAW